MDRPRGRPRGLGSRLRRAASTPRRLPCGGRRSVAHSPFARRDRPPRRDATRNGPADGRVWGSPDLQGRPRAPCGARGVPRTIPARHQPPKGDDQRDGGTCPGEVVGHRLSHRPPDVRSRARARSLVFEDLRPGRSRMGEHSSARPSWPSAPPCPAPATSVDPTGHPVGLPLLGLSKDRPSVVTHGTGVHSRKTPRGTSLRRMRATAPSRSARVVSHHLGGFLLRYQAHVLQCAPTLGFIPFSDR